MREENWYKMFFIALLLHVFIIGAFSIPFKKTGKRIDLPYYSVNLIGDVGPEPVSPGEPATERKEIKPAPPPAQKKIEPKKTKPVEKEKTVIARKERSLTPVKKKDVPQAITKDEERSLDQKIREMKSRTRYLDVAANSPGRGQGSTGFPASSTGGSSLLDPALQRYYTDVWEKIQDAWHAPNLSSMKSLVTVVSIRIRKDGKIIDWTIEKRSGNRVYDESVARALRSIDTLPPIPPSFNGDYLEIGFNFHPPGETK
jgi:TonB family protein